MFKAFFAICAYIFFTLSLFAQHAQIDQRSGCKVHIISEGKIIDSFERLILHRNTSDRFNKSFYLSKRNSDEICLESKHEKFEYSFFKEVFSSIGRVLGEKQGCPSCERLSLDGNGIEFSLSDKTFDSEKLLHNACSLALSHLKNQYSKASTIIIEKVKVPIKDFYNDFNSVNCIEENLVRTIDVVQGKAKRVEVIREIIGIEDELHSGIGGDDSILYEIYVKDKKLYKK